MKRGRLYRKLEKNRVKEITVAYSGKISSLCKEHIVSFKQKGS